MYLTNKYTKWYNNIVAKAQVRVNHGGYFEKHHIVPKSLGGSNDSLNLVKLTAKEHFICHLLLIRMTEGKSKVKMRYAAWMMVKNNPYQNRTIITGRRFQLLREQMIIANKERPGPNLGMNMSEETKQKLSNALKGRKQPVRTAEHKHKIGEAKKNPSAETRLKISIARKAQIGLQTRSEETKFKMSAWQKGVAKPKLTCESCSKTISDLNYKRWHGINCKHYAKMF
jgi:hypothetical protein